jgi:taurine-pyruvate aminotransferase
MGRMMAQNVIVGRTNSSFDGLNTVMNLAPSLIITKEQVDRVVAALRSTVEQGL